MIGVLSLALAGVELGSYGRVQVSTDAMGGQGDAVNVVRYVSRLEKDPYLELDLRFTQEGDADFSVLITPAISGSLFHYDGEWDADMALRNLYVQADDWSAAPLTAWAGSRMYRGDDVFLLDFWPLDDLNAVGGGLIWEPNGWVLAGMAGLNRLTAEDWQLQYESVPLAGSVGTEDVLYLDRQRLLASVKAGRFFSMDKLTFRVQGYAELQHLPEGTRQVEEQLTEVLPQDGGGVLGLELSLWDLEDTGYAHLWYRHARGLAAYDELSIPVGGYDIDHTVAGASEHLIATAGNREFGPAGVAFGAYVRRFEDADGIDDTDDRWEANAAIRPALYPTQHLYLGLELSHQWLSPDGLNPRTSEHNTPQISKVAFIPAIQPKPGNFARPQIRMQYVFSYLNNDARQWFAFDDVRHRSNYQHFVGVGAEWWINSATYKTNEGGER